MKLGGGARRAGPWAATPACRRAWKSVFPSLIGLALARCTFSPPSPTPDLARAVGEDGAPTDQPWIEQPWIDDPWIDGSDALDVPGPADIGLLRSCLDDRGIDFFAAAADGVLSLSWTNHTGVEASGGYFLHVNGSGPPSTVGSIPCTRSTCEILLSGPENGQVVRLSIDALDADGRVLGSSCLLDVSPRPLRFGGAVIVSPGAGSAISSPSLAGGRFSGPLCAGWAHGGGVVVSCSSDRGDHWGDAVPIEGAAVDGTSPVIAVFRRAGVPDPWNLLVAFAAEGRIFVARGTVGTAIDSLPTFQPPLIIGAGEAPALAARAGLIVVAFEHDGQIFATRSRDLGASFVPPVRIDRGGERDDSHSPNVAIHDEAHAVYVAFQGHRVRSDDDAYLVASRDGGAAFSDLEVRVDDDTTGADQRAISIAIDQRTGILSAAWEDHRGPATLYNARSEDGARTFSKSVRSGVGLGGEQLAPKMVADSGRNLYAAFIDITSGSAAVFSRANRYRHFDPMLVLTRQAAADDGRVFSPAVSVDAAGVVYMAWVERREGFGDRILFSRGD